MYKNLTEFIKKLKDVGELKIIEKKVSPYIEISRYIDAESKSFAGGKALYFQNVENSSFPVVANIFGSYKRICMALGVKNLDEIGENIREYIDIKKPTNFKEITNILSMLTKSAKFFPRKFKGKNPPCQEVVYKGDAVDLGILPVLTCWPKDAGPFITLPLVITKSLKTGKRNVGMYRLQIFDKNTTGMHWHIHKDGSHYYNEYKEKKLAMPVAAAIGAAPAVTYSATAPMPKGADEMMLASFIQKKPVYMTKCVSIDLEVPAEAEFVLEGWVYQDETRIEGPFGDHTGYYSLADYYPVFHVTALTHRKNAVYNTTLVGPPPMEDCYLAKATERLFLPMLQIVLPEIKDYHLPIEGVFHNIAIVSIEKEYGAHANKVISGLNGQGQMSFCKAIVAVDKDVSPSDNKSVIEKLIKRLDIKADISFSKGVLDVLDHSSPYKNFGSKIGIDLTEKFDSEPERAIHKFITPFSEDKIKDILLSKVKGVLNCKILFEDISKNVEYANQVLAVTIEKAEDRSGRFLAASIFDIEEISMFNIIVMFDKNIDINNSSLMLWKLFNNVDAERDIIFDDDRIVIDACKKTEADGHKREWPDDLSFD